MRSHVVDDRASRYSTNYVRLKFVLCENRAIDSRLKRLDLATRIVDMSPLRLAERENVEWFIIMTGLSAMRRRSERSLPSRNSSFRTDTRGTKGSCRVVN